MSSPRSTQTLLVLALALSVSSSLAGKFDDFDDDFSEYEYDFTDFASKDRSNDSALYSPRVFSPEFFDYVRLTEEIDYVMRRYRNYVLPVDNENFYRRNKRTLTESCGE